MRLLEERLFAGLLRPFASLRSKDFRRFVLAQVAANSGMWVQVVTENWLVVQLTGSAAILGITSALQFGPIVLFGLFGGVLADRFDRRRLLIVIECGIAGLALALGLVVALGAITIWIIWLAAAVLGCLKSVEGPALQAFVRELVDSEELPNAIALNNAVVSSGRMIGPAVGGLLFAVFDPAVGFFFNAATFSAVVLIFLRLNGRRREAAALPVRAREAIREGLYYIGKNPVLRSTVAVMVVVFLFAYNFQVLLSVLTFKVLQGGSELYGLVMSALGGGALVGSLMVAGRTKTGISWVAAGALVLAAVHGILALTHNSIAVVTIVFLLGVSASFFSITVNSTLQTHTHDGMAGRVMSVFWMSILGGSVLGAPLLGAVADYANVPAAFLVVAVSCGLAGLVAVMIVRRGQERG